MILKSALYTIALFAASAVAIGHLNTSLTARASESCVPAAESCAGGLQCCSGLFCSTTEPNVCSACIPSAEFCTGVPCCSGLFCGFETDVLGVTG
uniref:Uncharacterized protein n=1 Tax=Mycena chlorophos TaxID=658473 RepID=A0ABQ0M512_MYCCL|nr:predicted protein [Mycena chlorophos]